MRFPIASTVAATFIAGTYVGLQASTQQCQPHEAAFLETPEIADVPTFAERHSDTFFIESAQWDADTRSLIVTTRTFNEKGTLLTMMGLPESTWVDDFQITTDYSADFRVSIPEGHPVPCHVAIRSAFEQQVVAIEEAPGSCVSIETLQGKKMRRGPWARELFGRDFGRRLLADASTSESRY